MIGVAPGRKRPPRERETDARRVRHLEDERPRKGVAQYHAGARERLSGASRGRRRDPTGEARLCAGRWRHAVGAGRSRRGHEETARLRDPERQWTEAGVERHGARRNARLKGLGLGRQRRVGLEAQRIVGRVRIFTVHVDRQAHGRGSLEVEKSCPQAVDHQPIGPRREVRSRLSGRFDGLAPTARMITFP